MTTAEGIFVISFNGQNLLALRGDFNSAHGFAKIAGSIMFGRISHVHVALLDRIMTVIGSVVAVDVLVFLFFHSSAEIAE